MDLIPGHVNRLGFTADLPGVYYGECAEFCGDSHALMRFKVIAVDEASFQQWAAAMMAPPGQAAAAITGDVAQAPAEFGACLGCHRITGTNANTAPIGLAQAAEAPNGGPGPAKTAGPNLSNFACRTTIAAGAMPNDAEHLREWLLDPGEVKPGNYMATVIGEGALNVPSRTDPNRTTLDILVEYLSALYPDGGCTPITGENAENVTQLAPSAAVSTSAHVLVELG
jgi:cytochrome c oxidase subunit 2